MKMSQNVFQVLFENQQCHSKMKLLKMSKNFKEPKQNQNFS